MALVGVVLSVTLTACGGGGDPEADARAELKELGFSKELTDCAIKGIKKEAGSLEKYMKLDAAEQQTIASTAGANCASDLSEDEVGDLSENLEEQGLDLSDPAFRKSIITGMTTGGMPEEMANCILDKMIEEDLSVSDVSDAAIIGRIAQECQ